MKTTKGYALVAADGYLLLHTVRSTRLQAIRTYETLYNTNWEDLKLKNYRVIKVEVKSVLRRGKSTTGIHT